MRYKLTNVYNEREIATFGTCDLCFYTDGHVIQKLEFEDEHGEKTRIESGYWDWGDYFTIDIPNLIELAMFVEQQDLPKIDPDEATLWLACLVNRYKETLEEQEEDYQSD